MNVRKLGLTGTRLLPHAAASASGRAASAPARLAAPSSANPPPTTQSTTIATIVAGDPVSGTRSGSHNPRIKPTTTATAAPASTRFLAAGERRARRLEA